MAVDSSATVKKRVLVVDDNAPILSALKARFTHVGFDVDTAKCGTLALTLASQAKPDAAILDINMPGLDGFKVAERLQKVSPNCKVVFITASKDPKLREQAEKVGALFVEKPFDSSNLVGVVNATCA